LTLKIYHVDLIVLYYCKCFSLQHYILWLCILSMICISRTCFISCWDYIHITCVHKDDKGNRNFNHLSQKANSKHIILNELFWAFSYLFFCFTYVVSLNFLYVFLFSWPKITRAYTCWYFMKLWLEIMWKSDTKWKEWAKLAKVDHSKRKRKRKGKEKLFHCVLKVVCWWSLKSK